MKKNTSYAPNTRNKWEQIKKIFESVISKEKGVDITDINEPVQPKKGVVASNEKKIKSIIDDM